MVHGMQKAFRDVSLAAHTHTHKLQLTGGMEGVAAARIAAPSLLSCRLWLFHLICRKSSKRQVAKVNIPAECNVSCKVSSMLSAEREYVGVWAWLESLKTPSARRVCLVMWHNERLDRGMTFISLSSPPPSRHSKFIALTCLKPKLLS